MSSEDRKNDENKPAPPKIILKPPAKIQTRREATIEAIHMNDMNRLLTILEGTTLLEDTGYEMVSVAACANNFNAVRLLAEYGCPVMRPPDLSYFIPSPISYAIEHRNAAMVRFILSNGGKLKIKEATENETDLPSTRPNSR